LRFTFRSSPSAHHAITFLAFAVLFLALVLPNRLDWISPAAFTMFPLELVIICLLLLAPGRVGTVLRVLLSILLGLSLVLRGADLATHEMFARPFNLIFDGHLLADGSRLLTGVLGSVAAVSVGILLALMVALLCVLAFLVLGRIRQFLRIKPRLSGVTLLVLLTAWFALDTFRWVERPRTDAYAWHQLRLHAEDTWRSWQDIQEFAATVGVDEWSDRLGDQLFDRLQGKDVLVIFAESYGRMLLEREPFADQMRDALLQSENVLRADGFDMQSAFLTAPTVGGLSWLAHASALAGTWIDSETRYKSLVMSERATLNRLFREAGWRTVAAMPAISMAWPEGQYYGYDHIYDAHNFGYQGLPFNWVTMPDQYVLSALHERELSEQVRPPVMAEVALISSHAPWTPVAQLVPWSNVGDGRIFNEQAQAGPTPEEVWQNVESIRDHYRRSIEYMLESVVSYVEHYGNDNLVVLLLGDHPPAPLVSGDPEGRDVPVHLIARDPAVFEAVSQWRWQPGMLPDDKAPVWRMDQLRDRFVDAFSSTRLPLEKTGSGGSTATGAR